MTERQWKVTRRSEKAVVVQCMFPCYTVYRECECASRCYTVAICYCSLLYGIGRSRPVVLYRRSQSVYLHVMRVEVAESYTSDTWSAYLRLLSVTRVSSTIKQPSRIFRERATSRRRLANRVRRLINTENGSILDTQERKIP